MNKVPGEITVIGSFLGKESDFAVWIAKHGFDGTVLKPNRAIICCSTGQEDNVCKILEVNKPVFVNSITQTEISWANP